MKLQYHIITSIPISFAIYFYFNSISAALISFLSGVFIDIDHILDYILHGKFSLHLKDYYLFSLERQFSKIYLFFHSFEIMILLWIIISYFKLNLFWIAFVIGLTQHLILDCIFNSYIVLINPLAYFFAFRAAKGFRKELLFKEIEEA